jgi:phthalate 4,5-dioxygenase oxygenase subunit
MRRYWQPVALVDEFDPRWTRAWPSARSRRCACWARIWCCSRTSAGRWGLLDRDCPHRGADLAFGRHEGDGLRCPFHGWKFATDGHCLDTPGRARGQHAVPACAPAQLPGARAVRRGVRVVGPEGSTPPPFPALDCFPRRPATRLPSRACGTATGCRPSRWASTRRMRRSCTASCRTRRWTHWRQRPASSSAAPAPATVDGERWPMTRMMREFAPPRDQPRGHSRGACSSPRCAR